MKTIKGNLLTLFDRGEFDIIIQGCNCFNTMGAGLARQIKNKYPEAYEADCKTVRGDHKKLGTFSYTTLLSDPSKIVINAYSQYEYGGSHPLCYPAIESVFSKLNKSDICKDKRIGIPLIGAGLAGGDGEYIKKNNKYLSS